MFTEQVGITVGSPIPIGSMFGTLTYICYKNQLNAGEYTMLGGGSRDHKGSINLREIPGYFREIEVGEIL